MPNDGKRQQPAGQSSRERAAAAGSSNVTLRTWLAVDLAGPSKGEQMRVGMGRQKKETSYV